MVAEAREIQVSRKKEAEKMPARIVHPMEDIERLFEEFWTRPALRPSRWDRLAGPLMPFEGQWPRLDVVDRDNEVVVRAELPGVKKEDIEIALTGQLLTIKGTTRREDRQEKGDYYRCETSQGSFSRTVTLPVDVNEVGAKASLREGVLELTLPKVEQARKRTIAVD